MNPPVLRRARKEDQQQIGALWLQLLDEHAAMDPRFGVANDALGRCVVCYVENTPIPCW